jgi:hypothetical protein
MSEKLAYLAGLFDGEGSFSIQINIRQYKQKPSILLNPRMTMTLKYGSEVLKEFKEAFGGQIYSYKDAYKDGMVRWNLSKIFPLINATKLLLPYLRIKKDIANRFLSALQLIPYSHGERHGWNQEIAIKVAEIALTLNPVRSRKSSKSINYIETIKQAYPN